MNLQNFMCVANRHQLVLVIVFTNLVYQALSDGVQYEACVPRNCGYGPNISYPFWISGLQESYCGYPNFEINCKEIYPVLNFSDGEFIVKDIFYANHSFLLVNALVNQDSCGAPPRNNSLERTPFNLSSANDDLFFYYNCTSKPTGFTYPVDCASDYTHYSFALFPKTAAQDLYSAVSSCDPPVSVPVDVNANITSLASMNYSEIIKMGFLLNWTAINCSNCEGSEGRCGFENNNFVCFCQDGPHSQTCNDDKCIAESIFCLRFLTEASYLLFCMIFHLYVRRDSVD
ncbi:LEAF RUST 10 DISEASE-RESISTANCE LOCUS RECEPTOR-LIKE PROTEIN KINASE-like 1.2 [Syzygium oleosum]|uniref:LEAF RUST 10 DISEASE-RESISTANCE LOCUS RECEPTOR-LIKE PROTEIN KINASE-like 1.2 n=1 Tax=Syzygium oleosum TaxID=219896 RepID=UPI0011D2AD04|nr:LEAF RUST 10 DISEASE-RESISTANCE LOCUS RECEPTOR-LIKE PROTEIN KINASE-like 1.2 [Syzygium oleosum]